MPRKEVPAQSVSWRMARLILRTTWIVAAWLAVPLLLAGLAVRLTVRDDLDAVAFLFYATPLPVLAALCAICLAHWWSRRVPRWILLPMLLALVTFWVMRDFRGGAPSGHPATFRIAYWNVARPERRLDSILAQSSLMDADFFVFGEHRPNARTPARWQEHFAGKFVMPLTRELLLVAPEQVKLIDGGSLGGAGGCQICRVVIQGREAFLLMVDFTATFHKTRRPAFDRLFQIVDAYAEKPLLVIGDFNTPSDSAHFDRLRSRLTSAFEHAGSGYGSTWPMPLPVLRLDHIWMNKHLRALRCEHRTSLYSDHRAVVADIAFP